MENRYVVATTKDWNVKAFLENRETLPGTWTLITSKQDLNLQLLKSINPKFVFLPHWSWLVPNEVLEQFTCVGFHMTELPYGRGGSPLQNLIVRGHKQTRISAIQMTSELDAGPVFLQEPLSLEGRAEDIFQDFSIKVYSMINTILRDNIQPKPQVGEVTSFKRRSPTESKIEKYIEFEQFYDFVRMLDADTYPSAFLELDSVKIEFSKVNKLDDSIVCEAKITRKK